MARTWPGAWFLMWVSAGVGCGADGPPGSGMAPGPDPIPAPSTLVLFGGEDGQSKCLADTWSWDGDAWTELDTAGPSARARAVMAPLGSRIVLFGGWYSPTGGYRDQTMYDDTWTWDGTHWTQLAVIGPSARDDAVMAELDGKLVLFGGLDPDGTLLGDTWTFDGTRWTELHVVGPSARQFAVMAPLGNRLVLMGGKRGSELLADTWTFDGAQWTELAVASPSARSSAAIAPLASQLILFGGYRSTTARGADAILADTWSWDGNAWAQLQGTQPVARASAAMAGYDHGVVLFGGYGPQFSLSDTWVWDGATWTQRAVANAPAGRTRPALALLAR